MKTYSTGEVMCRRTIDGMDSEDWVPAHVAQRLYDALDRLAELYDGDWYDSDLVETRAALAAADGEEV